MVSMRLSAQINRTVAGLGFFLLLCVIPGRAQNLQLQIGQLDKLADKASNTVEVNLDKKLLQLAAKVLDSNDPEEAKVKELVKGLEGVFVRVFQFDQPGEYATADIDSVRSQLQGWTKIVGVRSRKQGGNVDVHLKYAGEVIQGL